MEDDDDYLPDFLKEDSVVESPFSIDDMVMPSDYEWTHLNDDFSVEGILKLNKEGKNQGLNLTGNQMWALDKIKDNLYNWDNEPGFSDIFHKEFCKKYGISLSILKALEKKGLIKLSKDDYYFKERGYIVYPKPLMYLVYISNQDYPDWFIRGSKEMGLWGAESFEAENEDGEKRFHEFKEDGEIEYLVFGKGRAAKRKTHLMTFSKHFGDEPFSMYDKYRGTPNGFAICGVTNRAGIHTFQWDERLTPDAVNCIPCSKYVQSLRDSNWLFTEEKKAESWLTKGKCAICNSPSKFTVMTAIGERSFCCEACYADYMGLPVEKEGYYGLEAETKKMNPLEKAGISGMASGATMEGLETLMAAEELSEEQLSAYFARLESQKPDLAREIEFSVKNEDELPTQKIYDAGFNPSIIEEWVDLVGVEDENLQPYESCSTCEGEGYVLTSYTSATRFDPADGDGEDCEECGGTGMIDPSDYMDKEGQYYAESFEAKEKESIIKSPYVWGVGIVGILGYAFTRKL